MGIRTKTPCSSRQAWQGAGERVHCRPGHLVVVLICAAVDGAARLDRALLARRHEAARQEETARAEPGLGAAGDRTAAASACTAREAPPRSAGPGRPAAPWTVALVCPAAMCAVAVVLVPKFAFGPALSPSFYRRDPQTRAAAAAAAVPSGVAVQAVYNLDPNLSGRDTVLLWDGDGDTPALGSPWVVANVRRPQFTVTSVREQKQRVALLERNGYSVVFASQGYVVLHRAGPAAGTSSKAAG